MARCHPSRASKLEPRPPVQTIAVGGDLLIDIFATLTGHRQPPKRGLGPQPGTFRWG